MPALKFYFFECSNIWVLHVIINTVVLTHLTWSPLFLRDAWPCRNLGLYKEGIFGSQSGRLMEKGARGHFTYFLAMSKNDLFWGSHWFPGQSQHSWPDHPFRLHNYSDLWVGAVGVGDSWQASVLWIGVGSEPLFFGSLILLPLSFSLLTQSQMSIQVWFTSGDSPIWPRTLGFFRHILSHKETFLPRAERKTSQGFRPMSYKSPRPRLIPCFGPPQHAHLTL